MASIARSTGSAGEPGAEQLAQGFAALLAYAAVGLGLVDRDLRFVAINEALAEINGLPVSETVGKTVSEVVPELAETVVAPLRAGARGRGRRRCPDRR